MVNSNGMYSIYPESFRANEYTVKPFRMIGLIDVGIVYDDTIERVTLPFFRSSGTNSGKIKGLWYPIVGIKITEGAFVEFTPYLNLLLTLTTRRGTAGKGWLAKSLFFGHSYRGISMIRGFSVGMHYKDLLWIGETLRELYEEGKYERDYELDPMRYNSIIYSKKVYEGNKYSQRENFEKIIEEIFSTH